MSAATLLRRREELPRAASYTYIRSAHDHKQLPVPTPNLKQEEAEEAEEEDEEDEVRVRDDTADSITSDSSGFTTPDEYPGLTVTPASAEALVEELKKVPSARTRRSNEESHDSKSSFESSLRKSGTSVESARTVSTADTTISSGSEHGSTANKSLNRHFGRRSWYAASPSLPSRSPSPSAADTTFESLPPCPPIPDLVPTPPPLGHIRKKSLIRRRDTTKTGKQPKSQNDVGLVKSDADAKKPLVRRATLVKKRPISGLFRTSTNDSKEDGQHNRVPVPPLPKAFSTDKLPIVWSSITSIERPSPRSSLAPPERSRSRSRSATRKKDELWSIFRSLEADYVKFSSKSSSLKANVVRDALLPFLVDYAGHASNENLRPEDLERRANILNMWWTGLIELLHGPNGLSLSGTDRPVLLEGIAGIMERPEWRQSPSPFAPLAQRQRPMLTPSHSTTSLVSSVSDFVAESVHHHVRNMFIQNLTTQMAFVVDKMSLRNATASLVVFCGKACAYAFMFVPGIADILIRLWNVPKDIVRCVLEENGMGKFDSIPGSVSIPIITNFPPSLHQLGFVSLPKYLHRLRSPPPPPPGIAAIQIHWWGRWLERWRGGDSDLFYAFVKDFHILISEFLPADTSLMERMCVPGLVFVHAQTLLNLNATMHRDTSPSQPEANSTTSTTTFDDLLSDPDAIAPALPVAPNPAVRIMAENRLIMLVRTFLSDRTVAHPQARRLFAESFSALLQATAKRISAFDHATCYTLLDFLEEALTLLTRYEQTENGSPIVNSEFWIEVYRRMLGSEKTTTEIRLFAFLYTIWNTVTPDRERKMRLCLDLLLERSTFVRQFNHWCPMVRAYYMRLLCWRVLRYDGEEHDGDLEILERMQELLQENWSQYLVLRGAAEQQKGVFPSSSPCNPAPGRRLLIIKMDAVLPDTAFLSFDGLIRSANSDQSTAKGGANPTPSTGKGEDSNLSTKSVSGFLRRMVWAPSSTSRTRSRSPLPPSEQSDCSSSGEDLPVDEQTPGLPPVPAYRPFSFRFSLEPQHYHNHHHHHANNHNYPQSHGARKLPGNPPMRLQPPNLPHAAQAFISSQTRDANLSAAATTPITAVDAHTRTGAAQYCGRALAEWTMVVGECQSFFERRRNEGVPRDALVETPSLGVEVFRRPG